MFTLRQMRYFDVLATTLHFGEAAQRAGVSQPALSVQIAEMEKAAGAPLFERLPKAVTLTALGRQFRPVIQNILKEVISLDEVLQLNHEPFQGALRLGLTPTIAPYLLPIILPAFAKEYSGLSLQVYEEKAEALIEDLAYGRIDAVIATDDLDLPENASQYLFFDPFFLATSTKKPYYKVDVIDHKDIEASRLMLLDDKHQLRHQWLEIRQNQNYRRDIVVNSLSTLVQLVANGLGETILPKSAVSVENKDGSITIIPFADDGLGREIKLYWRRASRLHKDYQQLGKFLANLFTDFDFKKKN